jgi:hypothetical protein
MTFQPRMLQERIAAGQKRIGIGWTLLLIWIWLPKRSALLMDQQPSVEEVDAMGEK